MPQSGYIFESGEGIFVGTEGQHDYVFASGQHVTDTGQSELVFESGTGLGAGQTSTVGITDSQGEQEGDVVILERAQDVVDYYEYGTDASAAEGPISDEFLEYDKTTFYVFKNSNTDKYSIGFTHSRYRPDEADNGGDISMSISGLPSGTSHIVRDDDPGNDSYSLNPPNASVNHLWSGVNTDGVVYGRYDASDLDDVTITFNITQYGTNDGTVPSIVKFAGDAGTTVERSYDGTNTQIQISFGPTFSQVADQ